MSEARAPSFCSPRTDRTEPNPQTPTGHRSVLTRAGRIVRIVRSVRSVRSVRACAPRAGGALHPRQADACRPARACAKQSPLLRTFGGRGAQTVAPHAANRTRVRLLARLRATGGIFQGEGCSPGAGTRRGSRTPGVCCPMGRAPGACSPLGGAPGVCFRTGASPACPTPGTRFPVLGAYQTVALRLFAGAALCCPPLCFRTGASPACPTPGPRLPVLSTRQSSHSDCLRVRVPAVRFFAPRATPREARRPSERSLSVAPECAWMVSAHWLFASSDCGCSHASGPSQCGFSQCGSSHCSPPHSAHVQSDLCVLRPTAVRFSVARPAIGVRLVGAGDLCGKRAGPGSRPRPLDTETETLTTRP